MKKFKKILILLTAAALVLSCTACSSSTDKGLHFKSVDGGYMVSRYDGTERDLVIPDTYNGKPVVEIKDSFIDSADNLRTVTIGKNVETIGIWAFFNCPSLNSIKVADGNENFAEIDGVLFDNLKETLLFYPAAHGVEEKYIENKKLGDEFKGVPYEIPDGTKTIGANAFFHNMFVSRVVFPDTVTVIEKNAFLGCEKLTSVKMSSNLKFLGSHALFKCIKLKEITLPATLEEVGDYALFNCDEMEKVYMQIKDENSLKSAGQGWLPKPSNKKVPIEWDSTHEL